MRKTKIVCTIGPSSNSSEMLEQMILAGMNVARINFSHGTLEDHKKTIDKIKAAREKLGVPLAIMLDTKGPEIRIGKIKNGQTELKNGEKITLTPKPLEGDETVLSVSLDNLASQVAAGSRILIDDGNIELTVESKSGDDLICEVLEGGTVKSGKGVNVPGVHIDMVHLSEKDKKDIAFGIENDIDFIAASFVRCAEDVVNIRKFVDYNGGHSIKIISKIENSEGVENFGEILTKSDGIMVARGDMGVEIPYEELPGLQKRFISECYRQGKMVITATQMLESMIEHPNPTRAEITDVANAVFDGTSAIMVSGETAVGKHPIRVIEVMDRIASRAETDSFKMNLFGTNYAVDFTDITNAMCDAACTTARDINASAIIATTLSGRSARRMSKFRPKTPIVAATPDIKTYNQLALSWGVYPVLARNFDDFESLFRHAIDCAKMLDMVSEGDRVVIAGGIPLDIPGNTNIIKVETIKSEM